MLDVTSHVKLPTTLHTYAGVHAGACAHSCQLCGPVCKRAWQVGTMLCWPAWSAVWARC